MNVAYSQSAKNEKQSLASNKFFSMCCLIHMPGMYDGNPPSPPQLSLLGRLGLAGHEDWKAQTVCHVYVCAFRRRDRGKEERLL